MDGYCCDACTRSLPLDYLIVEVEGGKYYGYCNEECKRYGTEYRHSFLARQQVVKIEQSYEEAFRAECARRVERQMELVRLVRILKVYARLLDN